MTSVETLITDAFEDLVIQSDEAPIEPSEAKTAIRALNQMMSKLASDGINLGYTKVNSLDDEVTIPEGAIDGVIANLALRLAPKYVSGPVAASLVKAAKEGYETLLNIAVTPGYLSFPSTLPIGSGNTDYGSTRTDFFPEEESTVESEQSGSISLESSTEEA